jgi:hypothetical protein
LLERVGLSEGGHGFARERQVAEDEARIPGGEGWQRRPKARAFERLSACVQYPKEERIESYEPRILDGKAARIKGVLEALYVAAYR